MEFLNDFIGALNDRPVSANLLRVVIIGIVSAVFGFVIYSARLRPGVENGTHPDKIRSNAWIVAIAIFAALLAISAGELNAYMVAVLFIIPLILAIALGRNIITILIVLLIGGSIASARLLGFV